MGYANSLLQSKFRAISPALWSYSCFSSALCLYSLRMFQLLIAGQASASRTCGTTAAASPLWLREPADWFPMNSPSKPWALPCLLASANSWAFENSQTRDYAAYREKDSSLHDSDKNRAGITWCKASIGRRKLSSVAPRLRALDASELPTERTAICDAQLG